MAREIPEARECYWAPTTVTSDHLRALTTLSERSVLVADRCGKLSVVTPDVADAACLAGTAWLLPTRSELLDAGLRESWTAGRLTDSVVEVCAREAAALAAAERKVAAR